MKRIIKNLGYQTLYQILAICLPLITSPYISRVLGAEGLGAYSYTYSVVNYFTLFAMLGTLSYGSKSIAIVKGDRESLTHVFWGIYYFQAIVSVISIFAYILFLRVVVEKNIFIAAVQITWIIGCLLDISWFFFGLEEFKITVVRNIVIKILTILAIFLFIKQPQDVWKYALIMSFGTLLSQIALWPFLPRYITVYRPSVKEVCMHIKPNIMLFVPLLGLSVYHIMDKTMLGIVCNNAESGYYYNADKVMSMPLTVIMATGTVMLPKMSELVAKGSDDEENYLFHTSLNVFMILTIGMAFGISAIAQDFIPFFFGPGYERCINLVYIFSLIMIFKALANIIRNQFLIPHNYERVYIISVFAGAILNLVANYILIVVMNLGAVGACLGTLVAEVTTCILYIVAIKDKIEIISILQGMFVYILFGLLMALCVFGFASNMPTSIWSLMLEVFLGTIIYFTLCIYYIRKHKENNLYLLVIGLKDLMGKGE